MRISDWSSDVCSSDLYPPQTHDLQAHLVPPAPNLALLAFLQDETQLIVVLPAYLRALPRFAIQRQTVIEHRQTIAGDLSVYSHQIFFIYFGVVADQLTSDTPVLRQDQQTLRVDIQPSGRSQAAQMARLETQRRLVGLVVRSGANQRHGRPIALLGLARYITHRLVQQYRHTRGLTLLRLLVQSDFLEIGRAHV